MNLDPMFVTGIILGTLLAFVVHEYAHAQMAYTLGDPSSKYAGRLTLNPVVHLHPWGTALLIVSSLATKGGCPVGFAKPVQIQRDALKQPYFDAGLIAFAGPFANFVLGLLLCLVFHLLFSNIFVAMLIATNFAFGLFNCFPLPGLDGWKMVQMVMPRQAAKSMLDFEMKVGLYGVLIILVASPFLVDPILKPSFRFIMSSLLARDWPLQ